MTAIGNTIGAAIVAYKAAAQRAFLLSLAGRTASPMDNQKLSLLMAQAEGNAIVDNLPTEQGGTGLSNWDGGQADSNYGGTIVISGGTA